MSNESLLEWSSVRVANAIQSKQVSPQEYMQETIGCINRQEPTVHAWRQWSESYAMSRADQISSGQNDGLLVGIPIGVKDIIDTVHYPTGYGSPVYTEHKPQQDAVCVALLEEAGGIAIGKTVTTEFAYFQPGPTTNPHNPAHTPGGSSSGSAAAVAAGMVPIALGSQTAGSLIRPASYCGIWGYKPSFGLCSLSGVKPMAQSLDTLGILARHVEDLALMGRVLIGSPNSLVSPDPSRREPPVVGVCRTPDWNHADADTCRVVDEAAQALARSGARVMDMDLPPEFQELTQAQRIIQAFEAARALTLERRDHGSQLSGSISTLVAEGLQYTLPEYFEALQITAHCRSLLSIVFEGCDVILAPSAPGEAPKGLNATGDPIFSRLWMPLHVPCINFPFGRGATGLPVGVQLIANYLHDGLLLEVAAWAERVLSIRIKPV